MTNAFGLTRILRGLLSVSVIAVVSIGLGRMLYGIGVERLNRNTERCWNDRGVFQPMGGALIQTRSFIDCLEKRSDFLDGLVLTPDKMIVRAMPMVSCRYIGVWESPRDGVTYQYQLNADGTFSARGKSGARPNPQPEYFTGVWSAVRGRLVWLYDAGRIFPPDINPITDLSDSRFQLKELDGSLTQFTLKQRISAPGCPAQ